MPSPDVKCIAVQPNGDVLVTWAAASPCTNFISYHVDTSSNPAVIPFTNYVTVGPCIATTALHAGANADKKRMYYTVETESSSISAPKDTFSTIFLTVSAVTGNANLNWNKISNHPIPTSSGWYKIYREYPAGNWKLRDSILNTNSYIDLTDVCNKNHSLINYRIEIFDNTGCTSVSNVAGDTAFYDNTPPVTKPIDTVSVNAAGLATVSWFPSPSPDADSVIIYYGGSTCTGWTPIAVVPVPQTFYTYTLSNAANVSECYKVAFVDSCGNVSAQSINPHSTIYLSASFDPCLATASLAWNSYINMIPAVTQYEIFRKTNAGAFIKIGSTSSTTYADNSISLGNSYCYFVRAADGTKTSSSNTVCDTLNVAQPPQFNYNRFATVVSSTAIDIRAYVDTSPDVSYYRLMRATGSGNFTVVLPSTSPVAQTISWQDNSVKANDNSYSYKWEAMNSCNQVVLSSDTATTLLLAAAISPSVNVTLAWNDYSAWSGKVDHYDIYRAVDGVWNPSPIGSVNFSGSGGAYMDDVAPFLSSKGAFSYYVVAREGNGNKYGFKDTSASNIAKVFEFPKFYIPNTFTPNGDTKNDVFLPVIGFIEPEDYTFTVFDNTGTPVFSTNNPAEGWDGKKKGHPCMEGVYMYLILCKASNGDDSKIAGTITLVR
ncbi:MAG: gliding motility-associated C-terminal domain-containing protein [Bacteroidetes bacterium]|nr:gliding motility-associated C-terminal domain-containing protein [Bacteroidota bacterium]